MRGAAALLLATGWLALACATAVPGERAGWVADWNARVDASTSRSDNPCGDFVFDRWADAFLTGCAQPTAEREKECERRTDWVWERSRQCSDWQDWLLRNTNRHQRRDDLPEPETRVR